MRLALLSALLLVLPAVALAADAPVAVDEGSFQAQRQKIEKDLADGETYAEISADDKAAVQQALARMADRLSRAGSVDALPADDKVALFNDQEKVNTILTQAGEDSRMVCERIQKTGSHRRENRCETVAERRRRRDNDQEVLQRNQRVIGPANN